MSNQPDTALLDTFRTGVPFALLRREGREHVEILTGPVETVERLADIPAPVSASDPEVLALVPYRQVRERGFECVDDGTPMRVLRVAARAEASVDDVLRAIDDRPVTLTGGAFDIDDQTYAGIVARVLGEEIGRGEGSNFVIHRVFEAGVDGDPVRAALTVFRGLLLRERGAYWTFVVHTGDRTLVGATPERHVSVDDGLIMMNPISGTFRHSGRVPDKAEMLAFLSDRKEIDELSMVLDEELKMMARVAERGGQVVGPYLKEMTHLTHTEYLLAGTGSRDVREVLRETMFAPTVVGSPIENACRVVARHEGRGRGYYGAVLALIGRDPAGRQTLDAPILIRTADIDHTGRLRVPVGATLVRHSTPEREIAETHAKAAGVLAALGLRSGPGHGTEPDSAPGRDAQPGGDEAPGREAQPVVRFAADPEVQAALRRRNATLAPFWMRSRDADQYRDPALDGRRVLVIDAEDTFTGMLTHQLRVLGMSVTVRPHTGIGSTDGFDLVVPGPGPGDPRVADTKMTRMRVLVEETLAAGRPMLAVCLGHQVLASVLGLPLHRKLSPYQGMQREVHIFGRTTRVGFYSTFIARCERDRFDSPYGQVGLARDPKTGDVYALRAATFAGVQFHPESVLSQDGITLVRDLVAGLLPARV
ncbi:anthranilate synthase family protein [Rugosimonospora africana]|uniref:anthranilate synthase n=1 Tax=Rugosimonospora africana TaxID=556532 RepID=A0A8J3QN75_9ACTN|nr:anthranilate synthase family protein [Rugosimonospora africana]GIH14103.1 phenazine-specific anthranilate synthase component I [Rugosimonospora africana]